MLVRRDRPAVELNRATMERYRPQMSQYYYNPAKYNSYLEQLGIQYPMVRKADGRCPSPAARQP